MSDFLATWELTRKRFDDAVLDLDQEQLNWRLQPDTLTIGQMAIHVAGVELFMVRQLVDVSFDDTQDRISQASTEGVISDSDFPFGREEITPELVRYALDFGRTVTQPLLANPIEEIRQKTLKSALGPIIDGTGAMARLAYHPGYHQGQVHFVRTAPGFPLSR
jgi:hypothetical protein